jgi:molybdate transport system substrate-binding protein
MLSLLLDVACQKDESAKVTDHGELDVAAAANLIDAFGDLALQFQKETGIHVVPSIGATADLSRQIENGAPFDVFAAADTEHVAGLEQKGLITPGTRSIYARGRLVLWVPPGAKIKVQQIEDLTGPHIERIAIAKPDLAPYGRAAVETLRAKGIWDKLQSKVVYGENVAQAKQFAATGNAEVAFVPLSLVFRDQGSRVEIDESLHSPIDQSIGVVKSSHRQETSKRFVDYVLSPKGQEILTQHGYTSAGITK